MKHIVKNIFPTLLFVIVSLSCGSKKDNSWTVSCVTTSPTSQKAYLYKLSLASENQPTLVDSTKIEEGKFVFSGVNDSNYLQAYYLDFNKNQIEGVEFLVANGDSLNIIVKEEFKSEYSGSVIAQDLTRYNQIKQSERDIFMEAASLYSKNGYSEEKWEKELLEYRKKINEKGNEKIRIIKSVKNPELNGYLVLNELLTNGKIEKDVFDKLGNALTIEGLQTKYGKRVNAILNNFDAYRLNMFSQELDYKTLNSQYDKLDSESKNSEWGLSIAKNLRQLEKLNIGQVPPSLIAKTHNNEAFDLDSIREKIIVIDFWASWCGPCRIEHPLYKELYNAYKEKGFTIISYSLDTNKNNWLKAIEDDGLDWINISNLKTRADDIVLKEYLISAIPANLIIVNGKIAARNIFRQELKIFLEDNLNID